MTRLGAEFVEAAIRRFDEGLNRAGFRTRRSGDQPSDWEWTGRLGPAEEPVMVTIDQNFPFESPRAVLPARADQLDWHQMPDGALCLWDTHSKGDQPWVDGTGLVARLEEWIAQADAGWPHDAPQLDLDAYHEWHVELNEGRVIFPLLAVDHWEQIKAGWFTTTTPDQHGLLTLTSTGLPAPRVPTPRHKHPRSRNKRRGRAKQDKYLNGIAVDLGEMLAPLISNDALVRALVDSVGETGPSVQALITAGRPVLVVARYTRGDATGFIGFWLVESEGGIGRRCFSVVERKVAQQRRSGWHASTLSERTVAVVGAGSVGSYVTDLLHRSGVQDLTVHDDDRLLPGNLVRHAASPSFVGASKPAAVRDTAALRDPDRLIKTGTSVRNLQSAVDLLRERDLVVDCTGDRLTWQLLLVAAELTGTRFLHVALVGHGQYGRVDVCPPLGGTSPLPEDQAHPMVVEEWESGCGDPVSPTPPVAVVEVAAMGARTAIRLLIGDPIAPAGESRQLFPVAQ